MSRKNKSARAFFHQNPNATPREAWDAAWANQQSIFHAKSIQALEARVRELEQYNLGLATGSQKLQDALRDCVRHMKTAGSPEAVRACEAAERLLSDA